MVGQQAATCLLTFQEGCPPRLFPGACTKLDSALAAPRRRVANQAEALICSVMFNFQNDARS